MTKQRRLLPRRSLGRTGLDISVLGLGGFHQVETSRERLDEIVKIYLEAGGNYVETARAYGRGSSEIKLGKALRGRRDQVVLASKTGERTRDGARRDLDRSLQSLQTDRLDLYFLHGVNDGDALDTITARHGALEAFQEAQAEGLIGHIAMSSHWPAMYVEALERIPLDAALVWGNYLDFCNFPEIPNEVLPALRAAGVGILIMKPLADGFLHRSPKQALRYMLSEDVDALVSGFNSLEMLRTDIEICCDPNPVRAAERTAILRDAPELGDYVCRQCEQCTVLPGSRLVPRVFELEGKFDRQMDDRRSADAAQYALRERLKGWFHTGDRARQLYSVLSGSLDELSGRKLQACRYGLDPQRKLRIADAKLRDEGNVNLL